jgi:hypothetical protein
MNAIPSMVTIRKEAFRVVFINLPSRTNYSIIVFAEQIILLFYRPSAGFIQSWGNAWLIPGQNRRPWAVSIILTKKNGLSSGSARSMERP